MILPFSIFPTKKLRSRPRKLKENSRARQVERLEERNLLAAGVDLLPQDLSAPSSAVVGSGQTIAVEFSIRNDGDADVPAGVSIFDRLYLSDDETFSLDDTLLGSVVHTEGLAAGNTYSPSFNFVVPNTAPGNRFLLLVGDSDDAVFEYDETNNRLSRPIKLLPATIDLDLVGSAVVPPTALLGTSIPVSVTIENLGPDATNFPFLFTRVLMSEDPFVDAGDLWLDLRGLPTQLAGGESFTDTWDLLLSAPAVGNQYILFQIDSLDTQFERDESNNVLAVPIEIQSVELEVSATAPAVVRIDEPVLVKGTVTNVGTVAPTADGWVDRVYLSADNILDANDQLVGSVDVDPLGVTIGPNQSYSLEFVVDLSNASLQSQFLIVVSDQENKQPELDKQNNIVAIPIDVTSPFDLSIDASVDPTTFQVDDTILLNWTVTNTGLAPLDGNWFDSVYLSADTTLDANDVALVSSSGEALGVGESYSRSVSSAMPRGAAYLIFVADAGLNVSEFDSANNAWAVPINLVSGPDITVIPTTVPSSIVIGDPFFLSWNITNIGDVDVPDLLTDSVYLSANDVLLDGDDLLLGTFSHAAGPLPPGETAVGFGDFKVLSGGGGGAARASAVAAGVVPGSYKLFIVSRYFESDRNLFDNVSVSDVQLVAPDVDLVPSDAVIPTEITLGALVNFGVTLNNNGSASTNASSVSVGVYYSADDIFDVNDLLVGVGVEGGTIPGGEGRLVDGIALFDQGVPGPGFILLVANPFAEQSETNLDNNVIAVPVEVRQTDLSASGSVPLTALAGESVPMSLTVTNSSTVVAPAGAFRSDAIYFSTDPFLSFDDLSLFSAATTVRYPLAPGEGYTLSPTVSIPSRPAGNYFILLVADASNRVPESNESNNVVALPMTLLGPQGNLQVVSESAPGTFAPGLVPSFTYAVQNLGGSSLSGSWFDAVYLSETAEITPASRLLSIVPQTRSLLVGESYTATVSGANLGSLPAGDYFLVIIADQGNGLAEANENDNRVVIPVRVDAPDLQVVSIDAPNQVNIGDTVNVLYTVQNLGTVATTVTWSDFVAIVGLGGLANAGASSADPPPLAFPLEPGETYFVSVPFTIPLEQAPGSYSIVVTANLSTQQTELSRSNNVLARPLQINDIPLPDLVVSLISPPPEAVAGRPFDLTWIVSNIGEIPASVPWIDDVAVENVAQSLSPLGSFSQTVTLAVGESITRTQRVTAPTVPGVYRIVLTTDGALQVAEGASGEANNVWRSSPFTVLPAPPPADLVVSTVVAPPSGVFSGQTVPVSFTVTNIGQSATNAPFWRDYVFLSSDPNITFDENLGVLDDQFINNQVFRPVPFSNLSFLNPGESYVQTLEVTIPRDFFGPLYVYAFANGIGFHFPDPTLSEVTRNNNLARSNPFTAQIPPLPDLLVSSVSVASAVFSGQETVVQWTQRNDGTAGVSQGRWTDSIYLSQDDSFDPNVDTLLGSKLFQGPLNPSQSREVSRSVTIPTGLSGVYRLFVVTDSEQNQFEGLFEGNNINSTPLFVELTPPPDLELEIVTSPSSSLRGRSIPLSYRITNAGATPVPNTTWFDSFYLSSDPLLDPADTLLARVPRSLGLDDGESRTFDPSVLLPASFAGSFFLIAQADTDNDVFELNKGNNQQAIPIEITGDLPDLVVSSVTVPPSATSGGTAVVSWVVSNQGLGDTIATTWIDRVFLSTDGTKSDDDVLLGELLRTGGLLAGGSDSAELLVSLPFARLGAFQILVTTDAVDGVPEGNELNNTGGASTNLSTPLADLRVVGIDLPLTFQTGQRAIIQYQVENAGNRDTFATTWVDDLFLSTDAVFDANDLRLASTTRTERLGAGQSYTVNREILIPEAWPAGSFTLFLRIDRPSPIAPSDPFTNLEFEGTGEANNQEAVPISIELGPSADLTIANISATGAFSAGGSLSVRFFVNNQGTGDALGRRIDSVYLSLDPVFDRSSDVLLGYTEATEGIAVGQFASQTADVRIPLGLAGQYFLIVVADTTDVVFERGGETNNWTALAQAVSVTLPAPLDLVVGSIDLPANAVVGGDLTIDYKVLNQSGGFAAGTWEDALYLSKDDRFDLSDVLLSRVSVTESLLAGGEYSRVVSAKLPPVLPGTYRVILRTDIRNQIYESNEGNNIGASLNSIGLAVPSLVLGELATGLLQEDVPLLYRLRPPAGETVRIRLNAANDQSVNEVYLGRGRVPTSQSFDAQGGTPLGADQELVISRTDDEDYYILVYPKGGSGGDPSFSLLAEIVPFSVTGIVSGVVGNAGLSTLLFEGGGFTRQTTFQLVGPTGTIIPSYRQWFVDASRVYVTFDLANDQAVLYDAQAIQPNGQTASLPDAVQVVEGISGQLELGLEVPAVTFAGRVGTIQVVLRNRGDADVVAPLLTLVSRTLTPMGLSVADINGNRNLTFYGSSDEGPAGIIRAGQTVTIPVFFRASDNLNDRYEFELLSRDATDASPLDWELIESYIGPTVRERDDFNALRDRLQDRIGDTWGDFTQMLSARATQSAGISDTRNWWGLLALEARLALADIGSSIWGRVTSDDPAVDVTGRTLLAIRQEDGSIYATQTLADGSYAFEEVPPGTYRFRFDEGVLVENLAAHVQPNRPWPGQVIMVRKGSLLTGRILAGIGNQPVTPDSIFAIDANGEWTEGQILPDGSYRFAQLTPGPYELLVEAEGYARKVVDVQVGLAPAAVDVSLSVESVLQGSILLPSGSSQVGNLFVRATREGSDELFEFGVVEAGRTFELRGLPSGTYTIELESAGLAPRRITGVVVLEGENVAWPATPMVLGGNVRGIVASNDPNLSVANRPVLLSDGLGNSLRTQTGVDGTYAFDGIAAGTYQVQVYFAPGEGFSPIQNVVVLPGEDIQDVDFLVARGGFIEGRVENLSGQGLAGVIIRAEQGALVRTAITDGNGEYRLLGLDLGTYTLSTDIRSASTVQAVTIASLSAGQTGIDFTLPVVATISGQVRRSAGTPIGATVFLYQNGILAGRSVTDGDGRYAFRAYSTGTVDLRSESDEGSVAGIDGLAVGLGDSIVADLVAGSGSITLRLSGSGAGIEGALARAYLRDGDRFFLAGVAEVDAGGSIVLANLAAGDYVLAVFGGDGGGAELAVTLLPSQQVQRGVTLEPLEQVQGLVKDSLGVPLEDADVQFIQKGPLGFVSSSRTNRDGTYEIDRLTPGEYSVIIGRAGFAPVVLDSVMVGGNVGLTTTLTPQVDGIAGVVVNEGGIPIPGATISLWNSQQQVLVAIRSAFDGSFSVGALPGEGYRIDVEADGYLGVTQEGLSVVAGSVNDRGEIVLRPAFGGSFPLGPAGPPPVDPPIIVPPPPRVPEPPKIWEAPKKNPPKTAPQQQNQNNPPTNPPTNPPNQQNPPPKPTPNPPSKPPASPVPQPTPNSDCPDPCEQLERQKQQLEELLRQKKEEQFTLRLQLVAQLEKVLAANLREAIVFDIKMSQAFEKLVGIKIPGLDQGFDALKEILEIPKSTEGKGPVEQVKAVAEAFKNIAKDISDAKKAGTKTSFEKPGVDEFRKEIEKIKEDKEAFKNTQQEVAKADALTNKLIQKNKEIEDLEKRLKRLCDDLANCEKDHNCDPGRPSNSRSPGGASTATGGGRPGRPQDPNDILGPSGFGDERFVPVAAPLPYTVRFENIASATAAAQQITVTQSLDNDLDFRTFRIQEFGFRSFRFRVPGEGEPFLNQRLDLRADLGIYVDVFANINVQTGQVIARFTAIDPATGQTPLDPSIGILPPNDSAGVGEGFLTYRVSAKGTSPSGAGVDAQARIVFDSEEPIDTPVWSNRLDAVAPVSQIVSLPIESSSAEFLLRWSGGDDANGSGVRGYTIYVAENGGAYLPWLIGTTSDEASFRGTPGASYAFFSVAIDQAGNIEAFPESADTSTRVPTPSPTLRVESPTTAIRHQQVDWKIFVENGPAFVSGRFAVSIDWNSDGTPDELRILSDGDIAQHTFNSSGVQRVTLKLLGPAGEVLASTQTSITIFSSTLEASSLVPGGVDLVWGGTTGDDQYVLTQLSPDTVRVDLVAENGALVGSSVVISGITGIVRLQAGDGNDSIDASGLETIRVSMTGGAGNDTIRGGNADDILDGDGEGKSIGNDWIEGGGGDDSIQGDGGEGYSSTGLGGKDSIFGGEGNDEIRADGAEGAFDDLVDGGSGDDLLIGDGDRARPSASGRDVLIAGAGADTVRGGQGSDLIVAGSTTLTPVEVVFVAAEWSRTVPRSVRIGNLLGPGQPDRANGSVFLQSGVQVVDDESADEIYSESGDDWLWIDGEEDWTDASDGDALVEIG